VVTVSRDAYPVLWVGQAAVLTLPVEIDLSIADQVRDSLLAVIGQGPEVLVADMGKTIFCDSAGVRALVHAFRRARASGCAMRLVVGTTAVQRVLAITGVDHVLDVYPTVGAALAGHAGQPGSGREPQPENAAMQCDGDDGTA